MLNKVLVGTNALTMRYMSLGDLYMVLGWCKEEGWNVGRYDAEIYYRSSPNSHMLFLLNEEPIGAISLIQYSKDLFTLGIFIVKAEYRKKGVGTQIWQYAMDSVHKNSTIALYAVPPQVERYKKSGFESQFLAKRWEYVNKARKDHYISFTSSCQLLTEESILDVSVYDQRIFGVCRQKWLENLIKNPSMTGFFIRKNDGICGYGVVRPCVKGFRIGPLFADQTEYAKEIFLNLIELVGENQVLIDIPDSNPYAKEFAEYFNLKEVLENDTQAMFRGEPPQEFIANIDKNYGIFSLEVG